MKKIKKCFCCLLVFSLMLTGCGNSVQLNDTQLNEVAEYTSGKLLQYCSSYDGVLVSEETETVSEDTEEVQQTQQPQSSGETSQNAASDTKEATEASTGEQASDTAITAGDAMGCSNFDVTISKAAFYDNYPADLAKNNFAITAESGKKLLVLKLSLKNTSNAKQKLDTRNQYFIYTVNGENISEDALISLLTNDIHFLNTTVDAGKTVSAVVVFQVDKSLKEEDINIQVSSSAGTAEIS